MFVHSRFQGLRRLPFSTGWNWVMSLLLCASCLGQTQPTNYFVPLEPGFNSIANHLNRGDNSLNAVIPEAPHGAVIYKWNAVAQNYREPAHFFPGFGWFSQDQDAMFLRPGEGAFMGVYEPFNLDFFGHVGQINLPRPAVVGLNFVSGHLPRAMGFGELFGFPPQPGDEVYLYDRAFIGTPDEFQPNASSIHRFSPQGWDSPPTFKRGRSAFVRLSNAPRILNHPQRQIVSAGQTVRFDVSVLGASPFSYQWQFNEDDLPGATGPSLLLSNVHYLQSGVYSVVVSNHLGAATSRLAHLLVRSPPVILDPPKGVQAVFGQDVLLKVRAVGTPELRYQWFRNGEPVPNAIQPELLLKSVNPQQHAGQYFVRISNNVSAGAVQSQAVPVVVNFPPVIVSHPVSQVARPGETVTFNVIAQGTQPLSYQWRLNGRNIPSGTTSQLVVSNVQPKHSGSYYVSVANIAGAADSERALLKVDVPLLFLSDFFDGSQLRTEPFFTGQGNNNDGRNEEKERPHCGLPGGSSVWVRWLATKRGIVTFDTTGSSFDTVLAAYTGNSLDELMEVACDDDQGEFYGSRIKFVAIPNTIYHIAIDGLDGQRGHIVLDWDLDSTSESLPVIVQQPQDQTALFNTDVVFSVAAIGNVGCYQWYYNDSPIAGGTRPDLLLSSVTPQHAGYYSVRIFAECGNTNRSVLSRRASLQFSFEDADNNLIRAFTVDKFAAAFDRTPRPSPPPEGIVTTMELNAGA